MSTSTTRTSTYTDEGGENRLIAVESKDDAVAVAAFVDGDARMPTTSAAITALSRAVRRHHHGGGDDA